MFLKKNMDMVQMHLKFFKRTMHINQILYYIMKTIAQTGIRVGELKHMTVEVIQVGVTIVWNKEKYRNVYFTNKLCGELQIYCSDNNISESPIFVEIKKKKLLQMELYGKA